MKKIILCGLLICSSGYSTDVSATHNWTVTCDPSKNKEQNEYDVIVVGAGIGGLSCASLLSKSGYKVLVLEQQSQVGGYCTSYKRNGFTFPVGAHDISGCDHGATKTLLDSIQLKKDDLFTLHTRTYILGDKKFSFVGTKNDVVQKLNFLFPSEKQPLANFFNEAEKAFDEKRASRKNPSFLCPTYEKWKNATYNQKLDEFFHDSELKQFLCSLLGYIGTKPENTTASDALEACLSYFIYGGYYPKNGGKLFADTLKQVIESHRGTVLTKTKVDEILVTDGHVTGVRTGDKKFLSSIVVANANANITFLKLIPKGTLDASFTEAINNLKMSRSAAIVNLGIDLDLSSFSSIVKVYRENDHFSFFISSNADPETAPHGNSSVSIGFNSSYTETPKIGTPEYIAYKEKLTESAIADLETIIPDVRKHIIVKDVITPRTFEEFTSMPEGALYSFDQSKGTKRPYFKTPITGLYLSSASTSTGAGVEAVVAAGLICTQDILVSRVGR